MPWQQGHWNPCIAQSASLPDLNFPFELWGVQVAGSLGPPAIAGGWHRGPPRLPRAMQGKPRVGRSVTANSSGHAAISLGLEPLRWAAATPNDTLWPAPPRQR